jgi:hypothetical protein
VTGESRGANLKTDESEVDYSTYSVIAVRRLALGTSDKGKIGDAPCIRIISGPTNTIPQSRLTRRAQLQPALWR